jgi:hypothetical protein
MAAALSLSVSLPLVDMRGLVDESPSQAVLTRQTSQIWLNDLVFKSLLTLAHGLKVSRVILAQRLANDSRQGVYLYNRSSKSKIKIWFRDRVDQQLREWRLSKRQKSDVHAIVSRGGAVIIVNAFADDAGEILSHEIGHHIAEFHAELSSLELFSDATNIGLTDPRFDDYCKTNAGEFYAESFRFFLTGEPMRGINLRRLLKRVELGSPRAYFLLMAFRAATTHRN